MNAVGLSSSRLYTHISVDVYKMRCSILSKWLMENLCYAMQLYYYSQLCESIQSQPVADIPLRFIDDKIFSSMCTFLTDTHK